MNKCLTILIFMSQILKPEPTILLALLYDFIACFILVNFCIVQVCMDVWQVKCDSLFSPPKISFAGQ